MAEAFAVRKTDDRKTNNLLVGLLSSVESVQRRSGSGPDWPVFKHGISLNQSQTDGIR